MPTGEKPYRVYRGGRVKGRVPLQAPGRDGRDGAGAARLERPKPPRRRWSWKRRIGVLLLVLLLVVVAWAVASYLAFRKGVHDANARLKPSARVGLTKQDGLLLSHATTILLLGTDHANTDQRTYDNHSDSIMLVRTDPDHHRIAYLSIPRDLRVPIPGHGPDKINAAFQIGGPALATRTVAGFTGLPINHLVIVNFEDFRKLIDAIGGITLNVPEPLRSRFECPYDAARCQTWKGWYFPKGRQTMDGRRALIYSRIRENVLNASDNDITRGQRQQAVLGAIQSKLTSPSTLVKVPFDGGKLLAPVATDLTAWQFVQLGWLKFRSSDANALHCRLGGEASYYGGQSVIVPNEDNFAVIREVTGKSAPQPPRPGSGPYRPGCIVGSGGFR